MNIIKIKLGLYNIAYLFKRLFLKLVFFISYNIIIKLTIAITDCVYPLFLKPHICVHLYMYICEHIYTHEYKCVMAGQKFSIIGTVSDGFTYKYLLFAFLCLH